MPFVQACMFDPCLAFILTWYMNVSKVINFGRLHVFNLIIYIE